MRILVGVDGSSASGVACELVASRAWPSGTRVTLLAAVEPVVDWTGLAPVVGESVEAVRDALALALEERADELRRCGLTVETLIEFGSAADLLLTHAAEDFADLIVVGSRGLGPATSAVLGSVSAHLVDHAPCPVLVARSPSTSRMLLAADGTASSRIIPRVLAAWGAAFRGIPVQVLNVAPRHGFVTAWAAEADDSGQSEVSLHEGIADTVADEIMELGWHAAAVARRGDPGHEIVDAGRDWRADLIVTGSRGIGTLRRLLTGSVAHDVLLHARVSVLVVRGQVPARLSERAAVLTLGPI